MCNTYDSDIVRHHYLNAGAANAIKSILASTLSTDRMILPLAPGLGLFLDRPFFDTYNSNQTGLAGNPVKSGSQEDQRRPLSWDSGGIADTVESFTQHTIWRQIFDEESRAHIFLRWILQVEANPFTYEPLLEPGDEREAGSGPLEVGRAPKTAAAETL